MRGNGPLTGYAYLFLTRPHFLDHDLYLRVVISPYIVSELIRDTGPARTAPSASASTGGSGPRARRSSGTAASRRRSRSLVTRPGRRSPITCVARRSAASCRSRARSAQRRSTPGMTAPATRRAASACPRTPRSTTRAPGFVWVGCLHSSSPTGPRSYRSGPPSASEHFTQRTWTRLGGIFTFSGTQASAFLNAGIAEDTDALSAFRLGGGIRLRAEFPLMLHGYNVEEIFARRCLLVNLAYRYHQHRPSLSRPLPSGVPDRCSLGPEERTKLVRNAVSRDVAPVLAHAGQALNRDRGVQDRYGALRFAPRGKQKTGISLRQAVSRQQPD